MAFYKGFMVVLAGGCPSRQDAGFYLLVLKWRAGEWILRHTPLYNPYL